MRLSLSKRSVKSSFPLYFTVTGEVQMIYSVSLSFSFAVSSTGSIFISAHMARSPTGNDFIRVSPELLSR